MEQPKRYSKGAWIAAGSVIGVAVVVFIIIGVMMANSKPQPCQAVSLQGWLYDADQKGSVILYKAAAGVQIEETVHTDQVGGVLQVDVDQQCTYGDKVYYHVKVEDWAAGWAPALYLKWGNPYQ